MPQTTSKRVGVYLGRVAASYLPDPSALALLSERAAVWKACAGEPLASHVSVVLCAERRLVLHADSSVWLNRLMQQRQTLIRRLREHPVFRDLVDLHVRVAPLRRPGTRPAKRRPVLPASAAAVIADFADGVSDAALRASLLKLAHGKGNA